LLRAYVWVRLDVEVLTDLRLSDLRFLKKAGKKYAEIHNQILETHDPHDLDSRHLPGTDRHADHESELSGRRRRDRRKAAVSMRLRNITNQFGSWHPDPFHFEWRPVYMRRCPALVKEENERVNVEILVNFLTIQIGGMLVISIFALAI